MPPWDEIEGLARQIKHDFLKVELKVRTRCGCSACASQIRCTVRKDRPVALAIARPVQCVASPGGGSVQSTASLQQSASSATQDETPEKPKRTQRARKKTKEAEPFNPFSALFGN